MPRSDAVSCLTMSIPRTNAIDIHALYTMIDVLLHSFKRYRCLQIFFRLHPQDLLLPLDSSEDTDAVRKQRIAVPRRVRRLCVGLQF